MNLNLIKNEYRDEMVGAFKKLRDMVLSGEISTTSFQVAQTRIWTRKDIQEAKGILDDPNCLCGWRIMRDGMEVVR